MTDFRLQAELEKLARVLECPPTQLDDLKKLSVEQLRSLREQISAALFDEHAEVFRRLAESSKLLPVAITAKLSKAVFGPMFSARISGLLPVDRAVAIARKLPVDFLADLTLHMDPRSARPLLRQMPMDLILASAEALAERGEYVTMARFVDALTLDAVLEVSEQLSDEQLLQIGFYVETPACLTAIIAALPAKRVANTVRLTAQGSPELRAAGLSLMDQVDDEARALLGEAAISLGDDVLQTMVKTASEAGALGVLQRTLQCVSEDSREQAQRWLEKL
mgnify:CR=1 FL=1